MMKIKLLMSTPQELIGECAKICYATKAFKDGGKDITSQLVHGHGHLAALRFAYATFSIEEISVACQNQIVRSKHLDFMVQSKRYVSLAKGGFKFIMPKGLNEQQQNLMEMHWEDATSRYSDLLASGVKKEDARAVLPANTSTNMNITGNLQAWWDFMILRLNPHAQAEVREVAQEIFKLLASAYPQVFTDDLYKELSK